jgi:hypothetical protein
VVDGRVPTKKHMSIFCRLAIYTIYWQLEFFNMVVLADICYFVSFKYTKD